MDTGRYESTAVADDLAPSQGVARRTPVGVALVARARGSRALAPGLARLLAEGTGDGIADLLTLRSARRFEGLSRPLGSFGLGLGLALSFGPASSLELKTTLVLLRLQRLVGHPRAGALGAGLGERHRRLGRAGRSLGRRLHLGSGLRDVGRATGLDGSRGRGYVPHVHSDEHLRRLGDGALRA